jgi:hypothetical protein
MKRRKFTVRFSDEEFQALSAFADQEHVIASVAVRWLIGMALADRCPASGQTLKGLESSNYC